MSQQTGGGNGHGGDDGRVTSTPSSAVGSLLTDLLTQAKAELSEEREALDHQLEQKQNAEQAVEERTEAERREALQQQLIAETRRRSEVLTRRDREAREAQERQAEEARRAAIAEATSMAVQEGLAKAPPPTRKQSPWVWVAAAGLVLVAGGVTAVLALNQPPGMRMPTLSGVADNAIVKAKLQLTEIRLDAKSKEAAAATARLRDAVNNAKSADERAAAEARLRKAVQAEQKASEAVIKRLGELAAAEAEAEAEAAKKKSTSKRRKPKGLKIKTDYFR